MQLSVTVDESHPNNIMTSKYVELNQWSSKSSDKHKIIPLSPTKIIKKIEHNISLSSIKHSNELSNNASCPNISIKNAEIQYTDFENYTSAVIACNDGFWLNGHSEFRCYNGQWNPKETTTECIGN